MIRPLAATLVVLSTGILGTCKKAGDSDASTETARLDVEAEPVFRGVGTKAQVEVWAVEACEKGDAHACASLWTCTEQKNRLDRVMKRTCDAGSAAACRVRRSVVEDKLDCFSDMSQAQGIVQGALKTQESALQACEQAMRRNDPQRPAFDMTIEARVTPQGKLACLDIDTSLTIERDEEQCIRDAIAAIEWAPCQPGAKPFVASYPLRIGG